MVNLCRCVGAAMQVSALNKLQAKFTRPRNLRDEVSCPSEGMAIQSDRSV